MKKLSAPLFLLIYPLTQAQIPAVDSLQSGAHGAPDSIPADTAYHYDVRNFKYWYARGDTLHIDTALTIEDYYAINFTRSDLFGYMPFSNIGQPMNPLTENRHYSCTPEMGFYAKAMHYWGVDAIPYYDVKKPFTQFQFNTGMRRGHALTSLFSYNPHSRLNLTFAYDGLRSIGYYVNQLASTQRFLFSTHYENPSGRYRAYGHYVSQNMGNEENGGITDTEAFESGNTRYRNRTNIPTELTGAKTEYNGKRFYWNQAFTLIKPTVGDTSYKRSPLTLYHIFNYESKRYYYDETADNPKYDDSLWSLADTRRWTRTSYQKQSNELGFELRPLTKGSYISAGVDYTRLRYQLDTAYTQGVYQTDREIRDRITTFKAKIGIALLPDISLHVEGAYNGVAHRFKDAYHAKAFAAYRSPDWGDITAGLSRTRAYPDMIWQLYRSFYKRLIYETNFSPVEISRTYISVRSEKYADLSIDFTEMDHAVYMDGDYFVRQTAGNIDMFRVQAHKDIRLWQPRIGGNVWRLQLDNRVLYQNVIHGKGLLPLPDYITRNTLYFQGDMFKKALNTQLGLGFYQFASFRSRQYVPFINEFALQKESLEVGGYPLLDFFVNGRVDRFKWMLKLQHFNADFTGYTYYSAPRYPYADFAIRVGIIWFLVN